MGIPKAKKPAAPLKPVPPVTEDDPNVQLAAQFEQDQLRRKSGTAQNRLIAPEQRASSGNLLISQTERPGM